MITHVTLQLTDNCGYDELVYVLSHDLRAPARALRQYVILLTQESQGTLTPSGEKFIGRLDQVLDRLDQRLDAILKLSRFGRPHGEDQRAQVAPLVEAALAEHGVAGRIEGTLPDVALDAERLAWMVGELVANVAHHAGQGATLTVSHEDGQFWFRDDGGGIPERLHKEVFMVFRPVPHPDSGRNGMGLSCISRVVRSVDGAIGIELPEGGGCSVFLQLPAA